MSFEIHNEVVNVFGDAAHSKIMVYEWALKFNCGRTRTEDDPHSR